MHDVCSPQDANQVNEVWGLTEEGEVNGVWRDSGHENLWFGIGTSVFALAASTFDVSFPTKP